MRRLVVFALLLLTAAPAASQIFAGFRPRDVADLPTCDLSRKGRPYPVRDATDASNLGSGGGSTAVIVQCDGSAYQIVVFSRNTLSVDPTANAADDELLLANGTQYEEKSLAGVLAVQYDEAGNNFTNETYSTCMVLSNLQASNDDVLFPVRTGQNITLQNGFAYCDTCTTNPSFDFEYVQTGTAGPTVTGVTGTVTAENYTTTDLPVPFTGGDIDSGDILRFDVVNTPAPTTGTETLLCVRYVLR